MTIKEKRRLRDILFASGSISAIILVICVCFIKELHWTYWIMGITALILMAGAQELHLQANVDQQEINLENFKDNLDKLTDDELILIGANLSEISSSQAALWYAEVTKRWVDLKTASLNK